MVSYLHLSKIRNFLTDIKLVTPDEQVIDTHKLVLCAASDYFQTMMFSLLGGNNKTSVLSVGADHDLLLLLINLLYTDQNLLIDRIQDYNTDDRLELIKMIDLYRFMDFPVSKSKMIDKQYKVDDQGQIITRHEDEDELTVSNDYHQYPLYHFFVRNEGNEPFDLKFANFFTIDKVGDDEEEEIVDNDNNNGINNNYEYEDEDQFTDEQGYVEYKYEDKLIPNISIEERDARLMTFYNTLYYIYGDQIENILLFNTILLYISFDTEALDYTSEYEQYVPDVTYWDPDFVAKVLQIDYGTQPDLYFKFMIAKQFGHEFVAKTIVPPLLDEKQRDAIRVHYPQYADLLEAIPYFTQELNLNEFVRDKNSVERTVFRVDTNGQRDFVYDIKSNSSIKKYIHDHKYIFLSDKDGKVVAFFKANMLKYGTYNFL